MILKIMTPGSGLFLPFFSILLLLVVSESLMGQGEEDGAPADAVEAPVGGEGSESAKEEDLSKKEKEPVIGDVSNSARKWELVSKLVVPLTFLIALWMVFHYLAESLNALIRRSSTLRVKVPGGGTVEITAGDAEEVIDTLSEGLESDESAISALDDLSSVEEDFIYEESIGGLSTAGVRDGQKISSNSADWLKQQGLVQEGDAGVLKVTPAGRALRLLKKKR